MFLPSFSLPPSTTRNLFCAFVGVMIFLVASFNIPIRCRLLLLILPFVVLVQWIPLIKQSNHPRLEVLFFDVGHGDAALVTMPNGRAKPIIGFWAPGIVGLVGHERTPLCIGRGDPRPICRPRVQGGHAAHPTDQLEYLACASANSFIILSNKAWLSNLSALSAIHLSQIGCPATSLNLANSSSE